MTRVTSLSTQQLLVSQMMRTQQQLTDSQIQVTSQKKTQVYSGITAHSTRVVNLETSKILAQRYIDNNETAGIRLDSSTTVIQALEKTVQDFKKSLSDFKGSMSSPPQEDEVESVQKWAFQALKDIQSYLNTDIDGQYLFSGSKITTQPVALELSTLSSFQSTYDGQKITYPTTRDAHLQEFSLANDGTGSGTTTDWLYFDRNDTTGVSTITMSTAAAGNHDFQNLKVGSKFTVAGTASNNGTYTVSSRTATAITIQSTQLKTPTNAQPEQIDLTLADATKVLHGVTGGVTMALGAAGAADTLTSARVGGFSSLKAGDVITISGSGNNGENDKTFTIGSIDTAGTVITLDTVRLEDEGDSTTPTEVDGTISSTSWYNGNDQSMTHRLNKNRSIDLDFNAISPAFEKAIRAMSIIAQGDYGTAGGLDQNTSRVNEALYLLEASISFPTSGTAPYGTETVGSFEQIAFEVGFMQLRVANSNTSHKQYIGFLEKNIASIENVDMLTAITEMQNLGTTLEASYQVFSKFQQLSLNNYL